MSGLRSSRYLLEAPMVIRMVLAVLKHLEITKMVILDNFGLKNCLKKSFSRVDLDSVFLCSLPSKKGDIGSGHSHLIRG